MKQILGWMAPVGALLLALLICGMAWRSGETAPEHVPGGSPEVSVPEMKEASTEEPEERKIQSFVVHQYTPPQEPTGDAATQVTVTVDGTPETMDLQSYLVGVLMGEMPASYPLEALKAQAVAARTYTLRRIQGGGVLSDDPSVCQAYVSADQAQQRYGDQADTALETYRQAVAETDGKVLRYQGELIAATYFSCSGGKTESAQAVWGGEIPYLVSVDSPGEEDAGSYSSTVTLTPAEVMERLEVPDLGVADTQYTEGGGVDTMTIGGKTFSGTELRSLLGLRSTKFTMEVTAETVNFSVTGFGHRVGMSQNGARVMAEDGKGYEEILKWYYTGVEICDAEV